MSIERFLSKYKTSKIVSFEEIVKKWQAEKKIDDFLGSQVFAGVLIGDALIGDGLLDQIDPNVKGAFVELMGEKADSLPEIRRIIWEKYQISPESVEGLINKIQGQFGENEFIKNTGGLAALAESGSQKGWDVRVGTGEDAQFIQVKVFGDADQVIQHIEKVNSRIVNGELPEVTKIDFAVNSEIFEEVQQKTIENGLSNKIYDIGSTRNEIRDALHGNFENINEISVFNDLFEEIFSGCLAGGAIHAAANAFQYWKGAKEGNKAIEDTIYSTGISGGGITASMITNGTISELAFLSEMEIIGAVFGPASALVSLSAGYTTREVLKRISERRGTVESLIADIKINETIIESLISLKPHLKKAS